jgi:hypothetical protein
MTVSVGVVALSEQALVLLRREIRVVIIVRSGEFSFAGEVEQAFQFPSEANLIILMGSRRSLT